MNLEKKYFHIGSRYVIDKNHRNSGEVELVAVYGKYFCRVKDIETNQEWDVMLNRLTIIEQ